MRLLGNTTDQRKKTVHRLVIFANGTLGVPAVLIKGALSAISQFSDVSLVAVCLPEQQSPLKIFLYSMLYRITITTRSLIDQTLRSKHMSLKPINIYGCARKHRFKIIIPPEGNINDLDFIKHLRDNIRPTIALSFYCLEKFSSELLGIFNHAINYHNGRLPEYRGRHATSWSLYNGEKNSGFTFHHMTEELDAGHILIQDSVSVEPDSNLFDLEMQKANLAAQYLPRILQMASEEHRGHPQQGKKGYYFMKDSLSLTTISDPSILSKSEIIRLLKAFEKLDIKLSGKWYEVTGIKEVNQELGKRKKLTFVTSDGVTMKAVHFLYLPRSVYIIYKWLHRYLQKSKRSPVQK